MLAADALLPETAIVQGGCVGIATPPAAGTGVTVVGREDVSAGPCARFISNTATITTITTIRMPMTIYGVRRLFVARTFRQFGQALRFGSTGAPQ
jgi:hypothetical protein